MKFSLLLIILLVSIPGVLAAELPQPLGYVSDFAGILDNSAELEMELSDYKAQTTIEISVVTISEIPEGGLFTYSVDLFEEWGIGKESDDNGILVTIVKDGSPENRLRIMTGFGIEGYIPDSKAGRILDKALPDYETGNYSAAASIIVNGIKENLESYEPGKQPDGFWSDILVGGSGFIFWIIILVILSAATSFLNKPKCPKCKAKDIEKEGEFSICKKCGKLSMRTECPKCKSRDIKISGEFYICNKCKNKFKKRKHYNNAFIYAAGYGGGFGGSGGGFGGFGGGGFGGGGAGR